MASTSSFANQTSTKKVGFTIVKRNGVIVPFIQERIAFAVEAAFRDTKQIAKGQALPNGLKSAIGDIINAVVDNCIINASHGACLTVEGIQDAVEKALMDAGHHDVARDYIVYRDTRKAARQDAARALRIKRRDEKWVRFNPMKIASAVEKGFRDTKKIHGPTPDEIVTYVNGITLKVVEAIKECAKDGAEIHVELIQDEIERQIMAHGFFDVAKDYILYRAKRAEIRKHQAEDEEEVEAIAPIETTPRFFKATHSDGTPIEVSEGDLRRSLRFACNGFESTVNPDELYESVIVNFYEGMKLTEIDQAKMMAAKAKIEVEPNYAFVAARLLLDVIYRETMGVEALDPFFKTKHKVYFKKYLQKAISLKRLNPALLDFDLDALANAMDLDRDLQFNYLGLQTLYDRYFIHEQEQRLETPQIFWMRVAMGLAIKEGAQKTERAIEFYNLISSFLYMTATPTLFNSGTTHSQLSSCYLSTVMDDLHHIFKVVADDAQLSKWAGGIGNDWTNVRATGALIQGTNGYSQGVVPFLKVANDTAVAVNQGGKRKGAMCAYLETWHLDIEDFLELRKNTGDERRRTHDMNTANWIPDLFMKRVATGGMWTLFSPSDVPELHDLYGKAFEKKYCEYEAMALRGELKLYKRVEALQLWRRMLSMLFETGHPWITFKDPSNIRSPQDHAGVVHSSNLCTEILLNTSADETAVCNLGSINLAAHVTKDGGLNRPLLAKTVKTALRMLDNVIDINFYPTPEAKRSNTKHRPVGLGMMGFQDALYIMGYSYASLDAVEFADDSMETISYYAILASSELAKERGTYASYKGSKWDRGLLPIDTINILEEERGEAVDMDRKARLDWNVVRESIKAHGMRNSNTMAIAPTATISNIIGITQSIEPTYKNLYVKSNLSGEFTVVNTALVEKLKELNLWDDEMRDDLKYFDGSVLEIPRIPEEVKRLFVTAFDIEPEWIIECASRRQKWIDMGQSLNLYLAEPSGKKLHNMYMLAWQKGLKTTYYLRTLAATQIEKSTVDINKRGLQPRWMKNKSASSDIQVVRDEPMAKPTGVCNLGEACESCQ